MSCYSKEALTTRLHHTLVIWVSLFSNHTHCPSHEIPKYGLTRSCFIGYATEQKGYHCKDLNTSWIIITCHVMFSELEFPFKEKMNHNAKDETPITHHFLQLSPALKKIPPYQQQEFVANIDAIDYPNTPTSSISPSNESAPYILNLMWWPTCNPLMHRQSTMTSSKVLWLLYDPNWLNPLRSLATSTSSPNLKAIKSSHLNPTIFTQPELIKSLHPKLILSTNLQPITSSSPKPTKPLHPQLLVTNSTFKPTWITSPHAYSKSDCAAWTQIYQDCPHRS